MPHRRKQPKVPFDSEPPDFASDADISRFDNIKILAYSGIFIVFGVAISVNDFKNMWVPSSAGMGIFAARIILFFEFVILAIRFVIATHHELEMWVRWLKNPIQKQEVYGSMFALAVILGLLLAFPHKLLFITGFMTTSFLFLYWVQWLANDHLARALSKTRQSKPSVKKRKVLDAMELYWLKRPQLARVTTMMYVSFVSFSLALAGEVQQEPQKHRFQVGAYCVLILNILIGEIVVSWWRHALEQDMRKAMQVESHA
jgi:hypothetical protein